MLTAPHSSHSSLLLWYALQQFAPHQPRSVSTASWSQQFVQGSQLSASPFFFGSINLLKGTDSLHHASFCSPPILSCSPTKGLFLTFICPGKGSAERAGSIPALPFLMLPHKMAVPLLLATEQLFSTLHKGTYVVVEERLLFIQPEGFSQPILLKPGGHCCPSLNGSRAVWSMSSPAWQNCQTVKIMLVCFCIPVFFCFVYIFVFYRLYCIARLVHST